MTIADDKPLLSWVMDYASGRGWQLQVAQTGERSSVLAWHEGQLMLGFWEGTAPPELAHPVIDAAFRSPPSTPAERHALLSGQGVEESADLGALSVAASASGNMRFRRRLPEGAIP